MHPLFRRLRAAWHPDEFHGWGVKERYFEGWYFKVVSPDERYAFAFIPGISFGVDGTAHAFIQVMDGKACRAHYHRFTAADFVPRSDRFELGLGDNLFSGTSMRLALPGFEGILHFDDPVAWPKMLGAPGIMGWYSFVPFMECNHGIVSMNHTLRGSLTINGTGIDFTGGKGYIEKDWGRSFPRGYVWMQSNHFDTSDRASLIASVAHIPWMRSHFIGFISGFWLEGRLYKFATYTGATKHLVLHEHALTLEYKDRRRVLRIYAEQGANTALIAPIQGEMTGKINESLQATLQVELVEAGKRIFEGRGRNAGLEVAGEVEMLI